VEEGNEEEVGVKEVEVGGEGTKKEVEKGWGGREREAARRKGVGGGGAPEY
jgi:hypothetical protein